MALLEQKTAVIVTTKFDTAIGRMAGLSDYLEEWAWTARETGRDVDVALHSERLAIETLAISTDLAALWSGPSAMPSILGDFSASLSGLEAFMADPAGLATQTRTGAEMVAADLPPLRSSDPIARRAELLAGFTELGVDVPKEMMPQAEAATPAAVVEEGLGQ